jgi:serine phosphatase RsbU (regulator of sigma subunit)
MFKKLKNFFIGKALAQSDDPFDNVRIELLLNFSLFLFITNLPYTFISYNSFVGHFISSLVQDVAMIIVIVLLNRGYKLRVARDIFFANLFLQNMYHFLLNNGTGQVLAQGMLFFLLITLFAFLLYGSTFGWIMTALMSGLTVFGIYNEQHDMRYLHFPAYLADPMLDPTLAYFLPLPMLMNVYLIAEFVRAQNKAKILLMEQKNLVKLKNKEITDSINYAYHIQHALLPVKETIYKDIPNSFILFKPKDIVSGDFYYFKKKTGSLFIAACDCTGHGVPGAIMSMIGYEKLEHAVNDNSNVSSILTHLNKSIKDSLRQSDEKNSIRDGMDVALCEIDPKNKLLKYAGANRPLWLIRKGGSEIEEIKATKKAIGGTTGFEQNYNMHTLDVEEGDTFYLFSDGYADQDGGEKGKKLMTKNFKNLLLEIRNRSMRDQEMFLQNFADQWRGKHEQLDDILVIGIRI